MPIEYSLSSGLVSALITILVATLFIYFAARAVLGRASFLAALGTALVATFLASLAAAGVDAVGGAWWLAWGVGIFVWALIAAIFFRAAWVQGAIIGLVAWVLYFLVNLVIGLLFGGGS
jgi:hypothetical protein